MRLRQISVVVGRRGLAPQVKVGLLCLNLPPDGEAAEHEQGKDEQLLHAPDPSSYRMRTLALAYRSARQILFELLKAPVFYFRHLAREAGERDERQAAEQEEHAVTADRVEQHEKRDRDHTIGSCRALFPLLSRSMPNGHVQYHSPHSQLPHQPRFPDKS